MAGYVIRVKKKNAVIAPPRISNEMSTYILPILPRRYQILILCICLLTSGMELFLLIIQIISGKASNSASSIL